MGLTVLNMCKLSYITYVLNSNNVQDSENFHISRHTFTFVPHCVGRYTLPINHK